ncbi:MAG: hypothetical protein JXR83_02830, partial [Deltaproteobacteria bacterium]|nr:hypothetical protein [Deltaproteobacteria bacterium]
GPLYADITGKLVRDNGTAATGLTVKLLADGSELSSVVTNEDGDYTFSVEQRKLAAAALLSVRASVEVNGKQAEVGLDFATGGDLNLPGVRFLEAAASPTPGTVDVTVAIPNYADPSDRRPAGYAVEVRTDGDALLATQTASASSSTIAVNRRLLENYLTSWRLKALLQSTSGGTEVTGYAAGLVASLVPQNAAPLSRGMGCTYANTANQTADALTPCPITDGDLRSRMEPQEICTDPDLTDSIQVCAAPYEELVVDLGTLQSFSYFAVHDVLDGVGVLLESSEDGTSFQTVTGFNADNFVLTAVSPIAAHYLRLKYTDTTDPAENPSALAGINEIVVY